MRLNFKEKGQGLVEYMLILVLVAIVYIASLMIFGPVISENFPRLPSEMVMFEVFLIDVAIVIVITWVIWIIDCAQQGILIEAVLITVLVVILVTAAVMILGSLIGPVPPFR